MMRQIFLLCCLFIAGCTDNAGPASTEKQINTNSVASIVTPIETTATFKISANDFRQNMMNYVRKDGASNPENIPFPAMNADDSGEFITPLSKDLTMAGHLDKKTGYLTDISYAITSADNKQDNYMALLWLSETTSEVLNPNHPKSMISIMIRDALEEYGRTQQDYSKSAILDKVKYTVDIQNGIGIMVTFSAV